MKKVSEWFEIVISMSRLCKKAQAAIMGLIFAFMLVAVAAVIQPVLLEFIRLGVNETVNVTHAATMITIIEALPLFIWLIVLIAVVALITGSQK